MKNFKTYLLLLIWSFTAFSAFGVNHQPSASIKSNMLAFFRTIIENPDSLTAIPPQAIILNQNNTDRNTDRNTNRYYEGSFLNFINQININEIHIQLQPVIALLKKMPVILNDMDEFWQDALTEIQENAQDPEILQQIITGLTNDVMRELYQENGEHNLIAHDQFVDFATIIQTVFTNRVQTETGSTVEMPAVGAPAINVNENPVVAAPLIPEIRIAQGPFANDYQKATAIGPMHYNELVNALNNINLASNHSELSNSVLTQLVILFKALSHVYKKNNYGKLLELRYSQGGYKSPQVMNNLNAVNSSVHLAQDIILFLEKNIPKLRFLTHNAFHKNPHFDQNAFTTGLGETLYCKFNTQFPQLANITKDPNLKDALLTWVRQMVQTFADNAQGIESKITKIIDTFFTTTGIQYLNHNCQGITVDDTEMLEGVTINLYNDFTRDYMKNDYDWKWLNNEQHVNDIVLAIIRERVRTTMLTDFINSILNTQYQGIPITEQNIHDIAQGILDQLRPQAQNADETTIITHIRAWANNQNLPATRTALAATVPQPPSSNPSTKLLNEFFKKEETITNIIKIAKQINCENDFRTIEDIINGENGVLLKVMTSHFKQFLTKNNIHLADDEISLDFIKQHLTNILNQNQNKVFCPQLTINLTDFINSILNTQYQGIPITEQNIHDIAQGILDQLRPQGQNADETTIITHIRAWANNQNLPATRTALAATVPQAPSSNPCTKVGIAATLAAIIAGILSYAI